MRANRHRTKAAKLVVLVVGNLKRPCSRVAESKVNMSSKKLATRRHVKPASESRAHKQFNVLAGKLHAGRDLLEAWRQAQREALALDASERLPLERANDHRLKELVMLLDRQHREAGLDDWERERLSIFITDTALDLLGERDDADLDELYARHCGVDVEEQEAVYQAQFKELLHEIYGVEISDDVDLHTPEGREAVHVLIAEDEATKEARHGRSLAARTNAEAEQARHSAQLHEAVDSIFRGLAEAQEAGSDSDQEVRQAGLELMQRACASHAAGDLPDLLAVRLELEQRGMASHFPEKQLVECNKLLKEELRQVELECAAHALETAMKLPEMPFGRPAPARLLDTLRTDIDELREQAARIERDLTQLRDPEKLKAWLRQLDEP